MEQEIQELQYENVKKYKDNTILFFVIAILLVVLDQITKIVIKGSLYYGELIPVINDILQITYIENEGMAFGISFGWGKIFLSIFSLVASGGIGYYLYKLCKLRVSNLLKLAITLILAGAFGNAIDRNFYGVIFGESPLFYGRVVDFILVDIPDVNFLCLNYTHFPVFNVADSCVTCGMILLIILHKQLPELSEIFKKNNILE